MSFDSREFRDALGRFATGVCVITAYAQNGSPFGMTVNSFASLSLDPPLVLWSIQNNSECLAEFESAESFAVNVLDASQESLSNRYAEKGDHVLDVADYRKGEAGLPLIDGSVTAFECQKEQILDGGDHKIIIGRVVAMCDASSGNPLLFYCGKYRSLK